MVMELLANKWIKRLIMALTCILGLFLLFEQSVNRLFSMGTNPWNARVYAIIAIGIIAIGYAWIEYPNKKNMFIKFTVMFGISFGIVLVVGGLYLGNDMATGSNYTGGNIWVGFDALESLEGVGKAAVLIANAAVILVPLGILSATVMMIFYSDTTDDLMSVIIEGGLSFGFMALYGILGSMFGWLP